MKCEGRVALVTGAAGGGMGRSIALTLAREGAKVAVNYRNSAQSAEAIVDHIKAGGGDAVAVRADVFQANDCRRLVEETVAALCEVDICIVNPGAGWNPSPPEDLDAAAALEDVQRELAPLYHLIPLVLPGMYERRWGRIVALSLRRPYDSPAYAYNVAKTARASALRLARGRAWRHGVTMNAIGPGPVAAIDNLEEAVEQCAHGPAWRDRADVSPQDIAEGVAFLCSDAGRFVSGCELEYWETPPAPREK